MPCGASSLMQRLAERQHEGLAGVVHRRARPRQEARDRGDVEHAAAMPRQAVDEGERQVGERAHVEIDHARAARRDRASAARPTSPKPALLTMYCGSSPRAASASPIRAAASGCARSIASTSGCGRPVGGDLGGQLVQPLLAPRHQHQLVAVAGKHPRQLRADAGRRAGDERDRRHAPPPPARGARADAARCARVDDTPSRSATRQIRLSSNSEAAPSA